MTLVLAIKGTKQKWSYHTDNIEFEEHLKKLLHYRPLNLGTEVTVDQIINAGKYLFIVGHVGVDQSAFSLPVVGMNILVLYM